MEDLFLPSAQGWQYSPVLLRIQMSRQNRSQEPNEREFQFQADGEPAGASIDVETDEDNSIALPAGLQATPGRMFRITSQPRAEALPSWAQAMGYDIRAKRSRGEMDDVANDQHRHAEEDPQLLFSQWSGPAEEVAKKPRANTEHDKLPPSADLPYGQHQAANQGPIYDLPDMPLNYDYMAMPDSAIDSLASVALHGFPSPPSDKSDEEEEEAPGVSLAHPGAASYEAPVASVPSELPHESAESPLVGQLASRARRTSLRQSSGVARLPSASSTSPDSPPAARRPRLRPTEQEMADASNSRLGDALETWYSRLNQLYQYKVKHGDCNVPQKHGHLGIWVNKQRMERKARDDGKKSSMTDGRLEALEGIGFTWAKRKGDHIWNLRFAELQSYRRIYGHANVPTKFPANPALGRWVSTQRSQYKLYLDGKRSSLDKAKIKKLKREGFMWAMAP